MHQERVSFSYYRCVYTTVRVWGPAGVSGCIIRERKRPAVNVFGVVVSEFRGRIAGRPLDFDEIQLNRLVYLTEAFPNANLLSPVTRLKITQYLILQRLPFDNGWDLSFEIDTLCSHDSLLSPHVKSVKIW